MRNFDTVVRQYLEVWNEVDAVARRKRLDEVFAESVRYVDPLAAVDGRAALDGLIGAARQQFAGMVFSPAGAVDGHHDQVRFGWRLGLPGEEPVAAGFDVAELDADGRIRLVLGFLDAT